MNDMHNEVITALVLKKVDQLFEVQTTEDSEELDAVVILAFLMVGHCSTKAEAKFVCCCCWSFDNEADLSLLLLKSDSLWHFFLDFLPLPLYLRFVNESSKDSIEARLAWWTALVNQKYNMFLEICNNKKS